MPALQLGPCATSSDGRALVHLQARLRTIPQSAKQSEHAILQSAMSCGSDSGTAARIPAGHRCVYSVCTSAADMRGAHTTFRRSFGGSLVQSNTVEHPAHFTYWPALRNAPSGPWSTCKLVCEKNPPSAMQTAHAILEAAISCGIKVGVCYSSVHRSRLQLRTRLQRTRRNCARSALTQSRVLRGFIRPSKCD